MKRIEKRSVRAKGGSAVAIVLLCAAAGAAAPAASDLIVVRDGRTVAVPTERSLGYAAAAADTLAAALGYAWGGTAMRIDGESVRFSSSSPFFSVGDRVYQLANPVYRAGGQTMIPLSWAVEWLPRAHRAWRHLDGRLVATSASALSPPARDSWLVVIDPGHGGKDPGAIGVRGTREKDLTLEIAARLKRVLEQESGIRVILTRDRDTLISYRDRPRMSQLSGIDQPPDLFMSIHANSMPKKPSSMRGFETYFLAVAKTEEARQVALRENASLEFEEDAELAEIDPLQFMLSDLQSAGNLRESRLFASSINRSLGATLKAPDRGVKQAGFWVLVGATMPAVLVEVGYISNTAEEKQLRSSSYQAKITDALADAVMNYLSEYGRRVWSSYDAGG